MPAGAVSTYSSAAPVWLMMVLGGLQHKKADVPFYVFDQDFGGCTHTQGAYGAADQWAGQRVQTCFSRHQLGFKYSIPSLFSHCDLKVPHQPYFTVDKCSELTGISKWA